MLLRELEPEKYWSFPATYSKEKRTAELDKMILSGNYSYQLKTDGNYSAFIYDFDDDARLITRGISKATNEYGNISDKVFFYQALTRAFTKPTRIMGEIYYDDGIDRDVGSVLRAKGVKAKSIQSQSYYEDCIHCGQKFTAKDKRDIENNKFFNKSLKLRIFDVWWYDGEDLTNTPWIERQKYVKLAAERIDHPLVSYVPYYPMDDNFYDNLSEIFSQGGEGVVCYRNDGLPEPGKRTAHKTLKVKQELENLIDCFIIGVEPATRTYTGKDLGKWQLWFNLRTGEKVHGIYFSEYQLGENYEPVTKNFFYDWPGAIIVGVYNKQHEIVELCKVAGLTEEFKTELRDNFSEWYMCPVTIGGMMLSETEKNINGKENTIFSVRHPYLHSIRANDINPEDCTLEKILS